MRRKAAFLALALVAATAAACRGEIVEVTAKRAKAWDGARKVRLELEGQRFVVYDRHEDDYLVLVLERDSTTFYWLDADDVQVVWGKTSNARVVEVPDANTLHLADGSLVAFGAVEVPADAASTPAAHAWLKELLTGKTVRLEYDDALPPKNGRQQLYVYVDEAFVNRDLARKGYARLAPYALHGRYAAVFRAVSSWAEEQRLGVWAEQEPEAAQPDVRRLSPAAMAEWARRLRVTVKVESSRRKRTLPDDVVVYDREGNAEKDRVDEITRITTLKVAVANGWPRPLAGMTARFEVFGQQIVADEKQGDPMLCHRRDVAGLNVAAGGTLQLRGVRFEFKGQDGWKSGFTGTKYYGYRITFYYNNTLVRAVCKPEDLRSEGFGKDSD